MEKSVRSEQNPQTQPTYHSAVTGIGTQAARWRKASALATAPRNIVTQTKGNPFCIPWLARYAGQMKCLCQFHSQRQISNLGQRQRVLESPFKRRVIVLKYLHSAVKWRKWIAIKCLGIVSLRTNTECFLSENHSLTLRQSASLSNASWGQTHFLSAIYTIIIIL